MPLFDDDDYNHALEADDTPNGIVDVSYNLIVERQLIDALTRSIDEPLSSPWMYCPLDDLPSVLGVNSPVEDDDDLHTALVLGGVSVAMVLINSVHEDSVPGLLKHLASLHDQFDVSQAGEESIIEHRYLLSQLVQFCEPADPLTSQGAIMRVVDTVFDDDGEVLPQKALATTKYLMCVALAVLCCDDYDCTQEMIEFLNVCHAERAAEPVVPYFNQLEEQEEEE